ncbi:putative toxin-antitoxin system, antitoxin component, Xre family [Turicibacter sp. HGF1]|nr:putative toxin-antitoxin system, antitoxin component, Xre family [Turicibacter sp. HGF1]
MLNESISEMAKRLALDEDLIMEIEQSPRFFNVNSYKACSQILEIPIVQMLEKEIEEPVSISYRQKEIGCGNEETSKTIELANIIFQEMVIQHKINQN